MGQFGVMTKLSPIVSKFETQDEADAYDRWFRAKVEAALADKRPAIPHDQVAAEMRQLLDGFREKQP